MYYGLPDSAPDGRDGWRPLGRGYDLCVNFARLKGAGAYVLDRRAARAFATGLLPMWLPFDHAIDREWAFGLRAAYVQPFPISQVEKRFRSSIQSGPSRRLSLRVALSHVSVSGLERGFALHLPKPGVPRLAAGGAKLLPVQSSRTIQADRRDNASRAATISPLASRANATR
jgi:hypothetical protein